MKSAIENRLRRLEKSLKSTRRHKSATVIYDPKISHSFDRSQIDADIVLLLPDNGRRGLEQNISPGSFIVGYSS